MKGQNRKRKLPSVQGQKKPMLPILRALGITVNHPLLVQNTDMNSAKKKADNQDVMKMLCFAGIPACCLSSKGSGPNESVAAESAAHAMMDFFRTVIPLNVVNAFLANPESSSFDPFLPVFSELDKIMAEDYLNISRCTQYDMTPSATIRGKEAKRRVVGILSVLKNGEQPTLSRNPNGKNTEIVILDDDEEECNPTNTGDDKILVDDEIIILNNDPPISEPTGAVKSMREDDAENKHHAERERMRQIRRHGGEVDFGEMNTSNKGSLEVFSAVPTSTRNQYTENYSSDSDDDEVPKKKQKLATTSGPENVVVHTTTAAQNSRDSESDDDELGEMVDQWNANDDDSDGDAPVQPEKEVAPSAEANGHSKSPEQFEKVLIAKKIPLNYQQRCIGVVVNEKLMSSVARFVSRATEHALDSMKALSHLTWEHYYNNSQNDRTYDTKMRARQMLFNEIRQLFPEKLVSLQVTGSTINGCGSYNSDVDMCLCYPTTGYQGQNFDDFQCERSYSLRVLRKVEKTLKRLSYHHHFKRNIRKCELISAKVPIIKLLLAGEFAGVEIDINVNHIAGIYNSHLIHYYSMTDARFPALALMVKHWAMKAGVNNSPDGYLNSYTFILLVIHYLQCGVRPAVLPNLQYLFPDKFDRKLPLDELLLFGDIASKLPATPPNTWSLGELLIGFFHYYSQFDFDNDAISIRSAQVVPRSSLPRWAQDTPMFVEEPFDAINTARSVRLSSHMNAIKSAFREAAEVFKRDSFTANDFGVNVVSR